MNQKKKELNSKMVRSSLGSYISAARKQKNLYQEEFPCLKPVCNWQQ